MMILPSFIRSFHKLILFTVFANFECSNQIIIVVESFTAGEVHHFCKNLISIELFLLCGTFSKAWHCCHEKRLNTTLIHNSAENQIKWIINAETRFYSPHTYSLGDGQIFKKNRESSSKMAESIFELFILASKVYINHQRHNKSRMRVQFTFVFSFNKQLKLTCSLLWFPFSLIPVQTLLSTPSNYADVINSSTATHSFLIRTQQSIEQIRTHFSANPRNTAN